MVSFPWISYVTKNWKKNFNCVGQLHLANEIRFWKKNFLLNIPSTRLCVTKESLCLFSSQSVHICLDRRKPFAYSSKISKNDVKKKKTRKQIRTKNGWVKHRNQKSCEFYREVNTSFTFNWAVIQFRASASLNIVLNVFSIFCILITRNSIFHK